MNFGDLMESPPAKAGFKTDFRHYMVSQYSSQYFVGRQQPQEMPGRNFIEYIVGIISFIKLAGKSRGQGMNKKFGVTSTGLIAPIIREGDNLAKIVTDTVLNAIDTIEDKDIIGITESVVARAQGNYVSVDEIAQNIKKVLGSPDKIFLYNPIYSRNRFAMILKAFSRAAKSQIIISMPPVDEVGNVLKNHPFTGLDYDKYYHEIVEKEGKQCVITQGKITADETTKCVHCGLHILQVENGWFQLTDFCKEKCEYGLLGSNKASEENLKLFPSKNYATELINTIQQNIKSKTGKTVEVMVYGDGCFKDPVGGIWEFADPVVSPAYTKALEGTPNELKLKNLADEKFKNLRGEDLNKAIKEEIARKSSNLKGNMSSQGTTPRRLTDLLGSLMDLTSGSGDKGTPIIYVKRYFQNYATEK